MKVLFWNINKSSDLTRLVVQIVADEDIDIVALIEADFSGAEFIERGKERKSMPYEVAVLAC